MSDTETTKYSITQLAAMIGISEEILQKQLSLDQQHFTLGELKEVAQNYLDNEFGPPVME
jgi:hypothetical protein